MRKPFIAANWKMHKNVAESVDFVNQIKGQLPDPAKVEVGIAPQAFALYSMAKLPVSLASRLSPRMPRRSTTVPLPVS